MPACPPNWDTLSGWQHLRKPCPRLSAQNGMRFPDGMPSGNRVPESRPRTGQTFRLKRPAETVSRNRCSNWDAVSGFRLFRKVHPTLEPNSGTQFPQIQDDNPSPLSQTFKYAIQKHKTADRMLFFKKYTSRNLPSLHNSLPFKVADYRPPIRM